MSWYPARTQPSQPLRHREGLHRHRRCCRTRRCRAPSNTAGKEQMSPRLCIRPGSTGSKWFYQPQMVACRQEKAQTLARDPLQPLQHVVMLPSSCSFASCWGQEASGDVLSQGRALLPSPPRLPARLSPGTASVFPWQFEKQKVRVSVRGELRSAFSSSSAAQPPRLSVARCWRSPPAPPPGRGKRVPV